MNYLKLAVSAVVLLGATDAMAAYTCTELGYDKTSTSKCESGRYWVCPLNTGYYKCDEEAAIGDIKHSSSKTADRGWVCISKTISKVTYSELWDFVNGLVSSPYNSNTTYEFSIRNYAYMRTRGTTTSASGKTVGADDFGSSYTSTVAAHTHKYYGYNYTSKTIDKGNTAGTNYHTTPVTSYITFGSVNDGGTRACPASYSLYTFIYAGPNRAGQDC